MRLIDKNNQKWLYKIQIKYILNNFSISNFYRIFSGVILKTVFLKKKISKLLVLRGPTVNKNSREQFAQTKRRINIFFFTKERLDSLVFKKLLKIVFINSNFKIVVSKYSKCF